MGRRETEEVGIPQGRPSRGHGADVRAAGRSTRAGDDASQVSAKRIQLHLIFEVPATIAKTMYIVLPGAALGAAGEKIAYKFDAGDVGGAASEGLKPSAAPGGQQGAK